MSRTVGLLVSLVVSCLLIVVGVALWSVPAALVVAGVAGIGLSVLFIEVGGKS